MTTTKLVLLHFLKWTAVHVGSACMTRQTTHEDNAAPEKMFHCHCALSLKKFQSTIVISKLPDKKDNTSVDMELLLMLVVFLAHMLQASSIFAGIQTRTRWRPGSLPERSSSTSAGAQLCAIVCSAIVRNCTQLCNCAIAPAQNRRIQCNSHYTVLYHREKVVLKKRLRRVDDL